ncbi:MAG: hypothetical protein E5Y77_21020 [Mesorhizobium sp.]|nr:MAG: hypothetical protein E5Y77_21020 [Mesorhizobium sp.]
MFALGVQHSRDDTQDGTSVGHSCPLLLVRIEESQKCAKGVHLADLAKYLEFRAEAARREIKGLTE